MQISDREGQGQRQTERTEKRQVLEEECVRGGTNNIQVYIVYKVPKATAAPMQQDKVWAFLFCKPVVDKTGGVRYCHSNQWRRETPPTWNTPGSKTSMSPKMASSQKHI